MRRELAIVVGLACLLVFVGSSVAQQAVPLGEPGAAPSILQPAQPVVPEAQAPMPEPVPVEDPEAKGLKLDEDGKLRASVTTIEPGTLRLLPLPNAVVSFVQNRQVIAQARTDVNGDFVMEGLTPWAVYSVIVKGSSKLLIFGTVVYPFDYDPNTSEASAEKPVASREQRLNDRVHLTAETRLAADAPQDIMGGGGSGQAADMGDVDAVLGGQFAGDGGVPPFGGGGAPFGGGGGGGPGGGGAGGAGLGAALGAVGLGLGAAALGRDTETPQVLSP